MSREGSFCTGLLEYSPAGCPPARWLSASSGFQNVRRIVTSDIVACRIDEQFVLGPGTQQVLARRSEPGVVIPGGTRITGMRTWVGASTAVRPVRMMLQLSMPRQVLHRPNSGDPKREAPPHRRDPPGERSLPAWQCAHAGPAVRSCNRVETSVPLPLYLRFAPACGPRVLLGAEPALVPGLVDPCPVVVARAGHMIDSLAAGADVALDVAALRLACRAKGEKS